MRRALPDAGRRAGTSPLRGLYIQELEFDAALIGLRSITSGQAELRTICRDPSAAEGPPREHCIEEARLVLALPECGPECRLVATAVLPHARR
jgi:hypothetical protein